MYLPTPKGYRGRGGSPSTLAVLFQYASVRGAWEELGGGGMFEELFGSPGDMGGHASRAELTECALRLCVERGAAATCARGERVLVILMVTERGSPAKYEDRNGVTTIRRAVSATCSYHIRHENSSRLRKCDH
jgi:hypothetical protein